MNQARQFEQSIYYKKNRKTIVQNLYFKSISYFNTFKIHLAKVHLNNKPSLVE